ncbi:hypothetical protein IWW36_002629 [Coemansia brasiliensis]|uniref:Uncharacterized protein n=1 Tax=Coemansia brasiliensis TaxID=2650707 RepID=A0A9W8I9A5_9FUNG|nr:hypothetical protein IWW36_002629 [Coemansia brasiliensis]
MVASKSVRDILLLHVRNASVLAAHHPAAAAAAYIKPIACNSHRIPMAMDPLQYILHSTDTSSPLPVSNARKLAMAIATQRQQQQHVEYSRNSCSKAETTKILSVQPQPHGHTIEVEMSASDLQRMLQRVSAARHSHRHPYCKQVGIDNNSVTTEAESATKNNRSKWSPPAMVLLSAVLGTGGVLLEIASSQPQAAATAFSLDPAFVCNALFYI